jgi:hypothetical protein
MSKDEAAEYVCFLQILHLFGILIDRTSSIYLNVISKALPDINASVPLIFTAFVFTVCER